jgi:hypothetical protein
MVKTVKPKARDTPTNAIPKRKGDVVLSTGSVAVNAAARTALPQPPKTSHRVPINSAMHRCMRGILNSSFPMRKNQREWLGNGCEAFLGQGFT